jgi:hypothetical protein
MTANERVTQLWEYPAARFVAASCRRAGVCPAARRTGAYRALPVRRPGDVALADAAIRLHADSWHPTRKIRKGVRVRET